MYLHSMTALVMATIIRKRIVSGRCKALASSVERASLAGYRTTVCISTQLHQCRQQAHLCKVSSSAAKNDMASNQSSAGSADIAQDIDERRKACRELRAFHFGMADMGQNRSHQQPEIDSASTFPILNEYCTYILYPLCLFPLYIIKKAHCIPFSSSS